jgi:uncharacterized OB-fold protein
MGLAERHSKTSDLTHWAGRIPVNYVYTTGKAGEKFFRGIINGQLLAAECSSCGMVYLPPRTYCERCFARLEGSYVKVLPQGRVHTFTICHKNVDGSRRSTPILMAMVKIDQTDGGLVHYLGGVKPEEVYIGMSVEAVFKPKNQRKGSILDIKYFKPKQ